MARYTGQKQVTAKFLSNVGDMFIIPYSRVAMVPKTPNFIHFLYFRPTFVMLTVESVRVPIVLLWGFG